MRNLGFLSQQRNGRALIILLPLKERKKAAWEKTYLDDGRVLPGKLFHAN